MKLQPRRVGIAAGLLIVSFVVALVHAALSVDSADPTEPRIVLMRSAPLAKAGLGSPLSELAASLGDVALADGHVRVVISFPTPENHSYIVEYRDSLDGPDPAAGWETLPNGPHDSGNVVDSSAAPQRFYRIRQIDPLKAALSVRLANDTGLSSADGVTSDPGVVVGIGDLGVPTDLEAALDSATGRFTVIVSSARSRQEYQITSTVLQQLVGGALADGPHTLHLKKYDEVRNILWRGAFAFVLDTQPPDSAITASPQSSSVSPDAIFVFSGSDNITPSADLRFECRLDDGTFSSCVSPQSLSGLALGSHTFELRAIDQAGNVDPTPASFTWTISAPPVDSPPDTIITSQPPALSGSNSGLLAFSGTDDLTPAPVLKFQCSLDGAAFVDCSSPTTFNDLADGPHTFAVRAIDGAGQADPSPATYSWTIDTIPPGIALTLDPDFDSAPLGDFETTFAAVDLIGETEPHLIVTLTPGEAQVTANAAGKFTFVNVALAPGPNPVSAHVRDLVGNENTAALTVTRLPTGECTFDSALTGWIVTESGGSTSGKGTVVAVDCKAIMTEGDSFMIALTHPFQVPPTPSLLTFAYSELSFDASAPSRIKDAFEAAIIDNTGTPLVFTFQNNRQAFFNISDGEPAVAAAGTTHKDGTVSVDLSHLSPGASFLLVVRLINNDSDTQSSLKISDVRFIPSKTGVASSTPPLSSSTFPLPTVSFGPANLTGVHRFSPALPSRPALTSVSLAAPVQAQVAPEDSVLPAAGQLIFTTSQDFLRGELRNVTASEAEGELRLSSDVRDLSLIWIANSGEGTVSKFDTRTLKELGRYRTGPDSLWNNLSPSRTTVDEGGNCWVANRAFSMPGSLVKVLHAHFIDRNGNGLMDTSSDVDGDGRVNGSEILPWDANNDGLPDDERIAVSVPAGRDPLDPSKLVPNGGIPRSTAIDAKGNVWVGLFALNQYEIYSATGEYIGLVPTTGVPYGSVVDSHGILWGSSHANRLLEKIDTVSRQYLGGVDLDPYFPQSEMYGITVDPEGVLWITGYTGGQLLRYDPKAGTGDVYGTPNGEKGVRGVCVDRDRNVWVATAADRLVKFSFSEDRRTLLARSVVPVGSEATAAVMDADGFVWTTTVNDNLAWKIDPRNEVVMASIPTGLTPYNLGDMTGNIRRTQFPSGTWTEVIDAGRPDYAWGSIVLDATTPPRTSIGLRVRSSNEPGALGSVLYNDVISGQTLSGVRGRYLQVQVSFLSSSSGTTPSLQAVAIIGVEGPSITIHTPAEGSSFELGSTVLVSGTAFVARSDHFANSIVSVTMNGQAVDAIDAAGVFFTAVTLGAEQNTFVFTALDSFGQPATTTLNLFATALSDDVDFSSTSDVLLSLRGHYAMTSFNERTDALFADLAIHNTGRDPVKGPLLVGIARLSDPTIHLLTPDGISSDGIPYINFTSLMPDGVLLPGQATAVRTLAFLNPQKVQFDYELVVVGQLNRAPAFTSVPVVSAVVNQPYVYTAVGRDPDEDRLTHALVSGPVGASLTMEPSDLMAARLTWTPDTPDIGAHDVLLRIEDGRGGFAEQRFVLSVISPPPNRPPAFVSVPVVDCRVNQPYVYGVVATDPDADALNYSLTSAPLLMTIGASTGIINWSPRFTDLGSHTVTVQASDGRGATATQTYEVTVRPDPANRAPFIVSSSIPSVVFPSSYSYAVVALDPDGDNLAYSLPVAPQGMSVDSSGMIHWSPHFDQIGKNEVAIRVDDGRGGFDTQRFSIQVVAASGAEIRGTVFTDLDRDGTHDQGRYLYWSTTGSSGGGLYKKSTIRRAQLDGSCIETLVKDPQGPTRFGGIAFDLDRGHFYSADDRLFRANLDGTGFEPIVVSTHAQDVELDPVERMIYWSAVGFNGASGMLRASLDGEGLMAINSDYPNQGFCGHAIDHLSRKFYYNLPASIRVSNLDGSSDALLLDVSPDFGVSDIEIDQVHRKLYWSEYAPNDESRSRIKRINLDGTIQPELVLATPSGVANGIAFDSLAQKVYFTDLTGAIYRINPDGTDPQFVLDDPDGPNYIEIPQTGGNDQSEPGIDAWIVYLDANVNGARDPGEVFTTTATCGQYSFSGLATGEYRVRIEPQSDRRLTVPSSGERVVSVATGQVVTGVDFGIEPTAIQENRAPVFMNLPPSHATVGQLYRHTPLVEDSDGDTVVFVLDPASTVTGAVCDRQTGVIAWRPQQHQLGVNAFILIARDNRGAATVQAFQVTVTALNSPPVITSHPTGPAQVGFPWQYQVVGQDADGDTIHFELPTAPTGMTIQPETGIVLWIPTAADVGTHHVEVVASDGIGESALQAFDLPVVVSSQNDPPSIETDPPTSVRLGSTYFYTIIAADPNGDPLTFTLQQAPAGMTITDSEPASSTSKLVRWTPSPQQFGPNPVEIKVSDARNLAIVQTFTIQVVSQSRNELPLITSTPPIGATVGKLYKYNASAFDPDNDPLSWSLDPSPASMSIDPLRGTLRWSPTSDQIGEHDVVVRVVDPSGGYSTQPYKVTVRATNLAPLITSTPPTTAAVGTLFSYALRASDAESNPLTYSLPTAPGGMTIDAKTGLIQWTPQSAQLGSHSVLARVADDQGGTTEQAWIVVVSNTAENRPPVITSSPNVYATAGEPYSYAVSASDPDGDSLEFVLLPPIPAGMTVDAITGLIQWIPTATQIGDHSVTVGAVDPEGEGGSQTFKLQVRGLNHPPAISSVPVTSVVGGQTYRYDVHAADSDADPLTYALTQSPPGMTIDSFGRVVWQSPISIASPQPIVVTVTDRRSPPVPQAFELAIISDTTAPFVRLAHAGDRLPVGAILDINAVATDNIGVASLLLTIGGVPVPLDARGHAEVLLDHEGTFEILAKATDHAGNVGQDSFVLTVFPRVDPEAPVVTITSPSDGAVLTKPTDIIGTVQDSNLIRYTVDVCRTEDGSCTRIFTGTLPVNNGKLAKLDTSALANDTYTIRVTGEDAGGNLSTAEVSVSVAGELKVGNFRLSFTDLSIPVNGIPITVARTYDTLTAHQQRDLGYGWRLEFRDADLRTSVPRTSLEEQEAGIFNPFKEGARVYVTLPGGKREGFTFRPQRLPGWAGSFWGFSFPSFVPDPGVTSQLSVQGATLQELAGGSFHAVVSGGSLPYNPEDALNFGGTYSLSTKEGVGYSIDANAGDVQLISDPSGNTLTFTDTAIVSSAGPRVTIERDPFGRITAVVDPAGKRISYKYSANGDLVSVTDREGNVTLFVYNLAGRPHYLTQVIDPRGRTGVRGEYDDQGRLVKLVDAAGKPVEMTHDVDNSIEIIKDPLGNITRFKYDERGNVIEEENTLGALVKRTYDLNNFMTSETDALGNTTSFTYNPDGNVLTRTDPLGNVTHNTYVSIFSGTLAGRIQNPRPLTLLATTTDPLGQTTSNQYDGSGNLTSTTDSAGNITRYTYDAAGNQTSITDASGNITVFEYDGAGRLLKQTDALGHTTTYTYDSNGNQLTQTTQLTTPSGLKTLTTTTDYDANGRPIKVTDSDGATTLTKYDALGHQSATVDALGHQTTFEYDNRGQLIKTTFPDATTSSLTYDAAGRRTASTDRVGRTTRFEYDAVGRLVKTIYPDATPAIDTDNPFTQTQYDVAGRVLTQIDERGNQTAFVYDAAGRQTLLRNALGHETRSAYDDAARKISETDPLGHTTKFEYDSLGRQVKTTFADATFKTTTYDALGRTIAETDQVGNTTHFEYDALGRLTAVIDALNHRTEYAYNEGGNLVLQRDANGHETRYEYETCCQRSATILPLGQRSTTEYNPVKNISDITDFNGNKTTFDYDVNNRLAKKTFPDGGKVEYAYTPAGRRSQISKFNVQRSTSDVWRFEYDARDRLVSRTDPDNRKIAYEYDASGNRTKLTTFHADGTVSGVQSFGFDPLNRLASVTDPDGGVTEYTYDEASRLRLTKLPNGTTRTDTFDALNRVTTIEHQGPAGLIARFDYTIDAAGRRTRLVENTGRTVNWTYDQLSRLTQEQIIDPAAGNRTMHYTMDPVGNRKQRVDSVEGTTIYDYDENDQLLTELLGSVTTTYTYDANGNTTSRIQNAANQALYRWDSENRFIGADVTDSGVTKHLAYTYNDDGIRVSSTVDGSETRYLIDANRPFAQVIEEYSPTGPILVSYTHGHHPPISQLRSGTRSYYHGDHLRSTRVLTAQSGGPTDLYTFDGYGNILSQNGTTANLCLFTGEQRDNALGSDYLRARYFDFMTGRFYSRDVTPGLRRFPLTLHPYVYSLNSPIALSDPSGRFSVVDILGALTVQNILRPSELVFGGLRLYTAKRFAQALDPYLRQREVAFTELIEAGDPELAFQLLFESQRVTVFGFKLYRASLEAIDSAEDWTEIGIGVGKLARAFFALRSTTALYEPVAMALEDVREVIVRNRDVFQSRHAKQAVMDRIRFARTVLRSISQQLQGIDELRAASIDFAANLIKIIGEELVEREIPPP